MNATERAICGAVIAVLSFGLFLPIGLAVYRNHPRASSIFAWNSLGLAAFGLGWFVALWLVLSDTVKAAAPDHANTANGAGETPAGPTTLPGGQAC